MGFFSNNDKLCPICGGATPRLLAKKFGGQPICSKCAGNILADASMVKGWSLETLQAHLNARAENMKTLESFTPTRTMEYEHVAVIDDNKGLFYIRQWTVDNPPVFRFEDIMGFSIEYGYQVVESWSRGMTRIPFQPMETGLMGRIAALAETFNDKEEEKESEFESLKVVLHVNTPYLSEYELCDLSVSGEGRADFANNLTFEMGKVNTICNLIVSLTLGASQTGQSAAPAPSQTASNQTADDIMKYKNLLDAGAITQEEFNAKKKQLLGL